MLERLKRPGYWIVMLAILTVFSFQRFTHNEKEAQKESLLQIYRAYGESLISDLQARRLLELQKRFGSEGERKIDLEDIALFIDTLHLEQGGEIHWKSAKGSEENLTLSGELKMDENLSYPVDMMIVRRGKEVLLRGVKVGEKTLRLDREGFPFSEPERGGEVNDSTNRP
ncbi:hypothetical protein [Nitratifractor sp.]